MRRSIVVLSAMALFIIVWAGVVYAGDFDWLKELNIQAEADIGGFRTRLGARFGSDEPKISALITNVDRPADAYMILRIGELAHKSPDVVLAEYRANKGKGWGVLAKSLGIKPGSKEFHELKRGHDLGSGGHGGGKQEKHKGKGKGKK